MKVLHISTSDRGGAGIAAVRLHLALLKAGVDSRLLTMYKYGDDIEEHYILSPSDCSDFPWLSRRFYFFLKVLKHFDLYKPIHERLDVKYLKNQKKGFEKFNFTFSSYKLENHPMVKDSDVINLHWVNEGFLDFKSFFSKGKKNIVWTLHDMNPFTGGCHHSDDCLGFMKKCGKCPQLKDTPNENIAERMLSIKAASLNGINDAQIKIVTPSKWLSKRSESSILFQRFKHEVIANCVNENIFFPHEKVESRKQLSLPLEKKIILFVAHNINNPRKGIATLISAFQKIVQSDPNVVLCSVGSVAPELNGIDNFIQYGYIKDDIQMALLYSGADVFVLPSMAENFPNTICESISCGTPVVSFNVGGISEQINISNGILVNEISSDALMISIRKCLNDLNTFDSKEISSVAAKNYSEKVVVEKYLSLYKQFKD